MIIASLYPCPFDLEVSHDYSAAILKDGEVYACEEEKLTGVKNDNTVQFPERSLMMGCKELGIAPADVDHWVFPTSALPPVRDGFFVLLCNILKAFSGNRKDFDAWFDDHVHFVDHHISHAAMAVLTSPFEECAFICCDGGGGGGDRRNQIFGNYASGNFEELGENYGFENLASFHSYVTDSLGYRDFENGKLSGLAAYGQVQPDLREQFLSVLHQDGYGIKFDRKRRGRTSVDPEKVQPQEYQRSKIFSRFPSETNILDMAIGHLPQDVAATCEFVVQEVFLKLLEGIRNKVNSKYAVFGGGLFQNVALNNAILESGLFEGVFFSKASNDSGNSLGQALYLRLKFEPAPSSNKRYMSPFLGPSFDDASIDTLLERFQLNFSREDSIARKCAELIAEGAVVGWFQGRAEHGPRSLGSRSILADPRTMNSKLRINQTLKRRDWFMPYAPSILRERLSEWSTVDIDSPYMQIALNVREEKQKMLPAAVHVDGSARIQTVDKSSNPLFWELISCFEEITGIPVVLNTSFNRHGIPTISSPRQAIEHLLEGAMDYLAIGGFIVSFEDNRIAKQIKYTERPENECLADACIKRLPSVLSHGTANDINNYLGRLGELLGVSVARQDGVWVIEGNEVLTDKGAVETLSGLVGV